MNEWMNEFIDEFEFEWTPWLICRLLSISNESQGMILKCSIQNEQRKK